MTITTQSLEAVFDVLEKHGIKPRLDDTARKLQSDIVRYISGHYVADYVNGGFRLDRERIHKWKNR